MNMKYFYNLLLLFFSLSCFYACSDDTDDFTSNPEKGPNQANIRRTVLLYCVAQNDMGLQSGNRSSAWRNDSAECALGAKYLDEADRCLIYVDDKKLPRLYELSATEDTKLVYQWGQDYYSTHPDQMYEVLNYVINNYESEEYGFVAWSHSDGWIPASNPAMTPFSFGIDVGSKGNMGANKDEKGKLGKQMNIADMAKAFERTNVKFKFILFDTCLMQCIETLYELRNAAEYIIGAPIQIPYDGAYYTHQMQHGLFETDVTEIAKTYFQDVTTMTSTYTDFGLSISVVNTSKLDSLAAITKEVLANVDWDNNYPDMNGVTQYYYYSSMYFYRPHYFDFKHAMHTMLNAADFNRFNQALQETIAYYNATPQVWVGPGYYDFTTVDNDSSCGISMFVPQKVYDINAGVCNVGNHNENFKSTAWAKAIGK
ncbi:MAG: hypothetical protein J6R79_02800 [Bacteroidaceae bacterium]|nr:hypothetical protein [Bacteroidaceae bacterium]